MTFAQAAQKAIEYGGKFDGHELPADINAFTKTSATALVGQGLMAVAKDAYPRDGQTQSYVVGFAEVEVDIETGVYTVEHYTALADVLVKALISAGSSCPSNLPPYSIAF